MTDSFITNRNELMHQRLQAWLRENESTDVEYLGQHCDVLGQLNYWYRIGQYDVTVDCIEDINLTEQNDYD